MAQRCGVCAHPRIGEIEERLHGPHNVSYLSREYSLTRQSIQRHRANHLGRLDLNESLDEEEPRPPQASAQDTFLANYLQSADVREALREAGVTRATLRKWQEHDEGFALRYHQAEAETIEVLEAEARTRAIAGSKMIRRVYRQGHLYEEIHEYRPSDAMLVKLLQAHKPDKYGDKLAITQTTIVKAVDAEAWDAV